MDFGQRLKKLRKQKGFNQTRLAELAGTTESNISRYERGMIIPKGNISSNLAQMLGTSVEYLMSGVKPHSYDLDDDVLEIAESIQLLNKEDRETLKHIIDKFTFMEAMQINKSIKEIEIIN